MPRLNAARSAQFAQAAEFVFSFNDFAVGTDGVPRTFGSTVALADPAGLTPALQAGTGITLDAINMPRGATIVGGEVICEVAYAGVGAAATLGIGTAAAPAALLAAADLDAMVAGARTALLLTAPLTCNDGSNVRVTTAGLTATATAGRFRVRVQYTIDGRDHEVVPA